MPLSPSVRDFDNKIRKDIKQALKNGKAPIGEKRLKDMKYELYKMMFSK
jgi:hypothetical protein